MKNLYKKLSTLKNGAIKLTLGSGRVTQMKLLTKQAEAAYKILDSFLEKSIPFICLIIISAEVKKVIADFKRLLAGFNTGFSLLSNHS